MIYVKIRRGSFEGNLYIAIQGWRKCIEENLAYLIKLTYNEEIEPNKRGVREFRRKKGISFKDMIENSSLEKAFYSLVRAIRAIDR